MNMWFFRSPQTRAAQLVDFAQAVQRGSTYTHPVKMLCRIKVAGEDMTVPYDLLASEPDAFKDEGFDDVEVLGEGDIVGMNYMRTEEIVEEMREMDLWIPSCLMTGRRATA